MSMETYKACLSAFVVLVVAGAGLLGFDVDGEALQNFLSVIAYLAAIVWGIWHNHNFTKAAQQAQKYLDHLRSIEGE